MKTYVVAGLGRFGTSVAIRLSELGNEVLVIDENADRIQQISNLVTHAVVADTKDQEVLRALGVRNYDCAIVAIGGDLAASILTTLNFKELGVPRIICKAHDESHRKVLEKVGADRVVIPEHEIAWKLAQTLSSANVMEYIELSKDYGIVEFAAPKSWIGDTLRHLDVRAKIGVNIIAVRHDSSIQVSPGPDYVVKPSDTIVALGKYSALDVVESL